MNLKTFVPAPKLVGKISKSSMRVTSKGMISFSKAAIAQLNFPINRISFHQDQDEKSEWYISVGPTAHYATRKAGFNCSQLAQSILESTECAGEDSVAFLLATEVIEPAIDGMPTYAILTASKILKSK